MKEEQENRNGANDRVEALEGRSVSRRDFLKLAGIAGAVVGVGGGLGGLLAACGGTTTTTTTAATTVTTAGPTTTAGSTTSVTAGPTQGREIKFGFMTPQTGGLAGFGIPDKWCADRWQEFAKAGHLVDAAGVEHPMSVLVRDTQSDINFAGTVAATLINNDKVDILMAASTTDTTIPACLQGEALGCPTITTDSPSDSLLGGLGMSTTDQAKWWYFYFWDNQSLYNACIMLYKDSAITTNKKVACLWPNDVEGNDRRRFFTPQLARDGFEIVDPGGFQHGQEDWSTVINQFKAANCEILQGLVIPPDWAVFWKQCYQLSWVPKICDIGIQTLFPETMVALGDIGYGMAGPSWWHPLNPFKSSLTGETCADLALSYEQATGNQWTQPIAHYTLFEWAVDVIKRTKNVDDKEEVIQNVASTKMTTILGPMDFTTPVETGTTKVGVRSFPNICSSIMWNGQWVKGTTQNPWSTKIWPYDLLIVEPSDVGGYLQQQAPPIVMPGTTYK